MGYPRVIDEEYLVESQFICCQAPATRPDWRPDNTKAAGKVKLGELFYHGMLEVGTDTEGLYMAPARCPCWAALPCLLPPPADRRPCCCLDCCAEPGAQQSIPWEDIVDAGTETMTTTNGKELMRKLVITPSPGRSVQLALMETNWSGGANWQDYMAGGELVERVEQGRERSRSRSPSGPLSGKISAAPTTDMSR